MRNSQVVLLGLIALYVVYLLRLRSPTNDRIAYLALAVLGVALVINPEWTNAAAGLLGVGRGADLMFYFFIMFCLFHFATTANTIRRLQRDITTLTRELAIRHPLTLENDPAAGAVDIDDGSSTTPRAP